MKRVCVLIFLLSLCLGSFSQEITVRFTGQLNGTDYCRLDSMAVTNLTRDWTETIEYPDTIIVLGGTVGTNLNIAATQWLGQNIPNPFDCETRVELSVSQRENVRMQLLDASGKQYADYRGSLDAGVHTFDISAAAPQTYVLNATVGNRSYSIRMVNMGSGCGSSIKYAGISGSITAKLTTANEFQNGDNMHYIGYVTIGSEVVASNVVEQPQTASEDITLNFTHCQPLAEHVEVTACDSYEWNNETYNVSDDYQQTFVAANGCDSVVTLHLTINRSNTGIDEQTACDSYTWIDGVSYTESTNEPTFTLTNAEGCDSVVILHLTINRSNTGIDEQTACDSYEWIDGVTYTESTTEPTFTLTNAVGCDSVVTLHLTINHSNTGIDTQTACDFYTWIDGVTYTESTNEPTFTLTNSTGCDSVVTLHLTINQPLAELVEVNACDSYDWNGEIYTESGDFVQTLQTVNGCDSVVTLHLTINRSQTERVEVEACDSYDWNGEIYTESGDFIQTLQTVNGCDSVVTLHLTINRSQTERVEVEVCDSYDWNGEIYTESGDFIQNLQTVNGCDSVVTLHLTINRNTGIDMQRACDSYTWINGVTYTESTTEPTYTLTNVAGCDSVVTLHLTINRNTGVDTQSACDSYTWIDGVTYTESTTEPTYTLTNVVGCDSVVTLHLTINHSNTGIDTHTACDSYTWINGITYTQSTNEPTFTLTNAVGCDSVVTLHLTIKHSSTGTDTQTACGNYTWIDGITYTESTNVPTCTLTNAVGCDSVVTLHLTMICPPTVQTNAATSITGTGATFRGTVTSDGGATVTARGFLYGTSYSSLMQIVQSGSGTGFFPTNIADLNSGTTYYYKAYATNSVGTAYGEIRSFTTLTLPTVFTYNAYDIITTRATLKGKITANGGETVTARGFLLGTDSNNLTRDIQSGSGTGDYSYNVTDLMYGTTYYYKAYATTSAGTAYGQMRSFTLYSEPTSYENGIGYVDLGLPSGTLWAYTNIGADGPTSYGSYYAWGETNTKSTYTSDNYTYSNNPEILPASNDAATVIWGGGWRMPTYQEFDELLNNCTKSRERRNYVYGELFIGPNGNSIFLPASGFYDDSGSRYYSSRGYYLSSTQSNSSNAFYLYFDSDTCNIDSNNRYYGQSVRPIIPNYTTIPTVTTGTSSNISSTAATLSGTVLSDGGRIVTVRGFYYGINSNNLMQSVQSDNATDNFTVNITGLAANTTYYYKAYATNSIGEAYGEVMSFTTMEATVPIVTTGKSISITTVGATLNGNVTSDGGVSVTARGFLYGTSEDNLSQIVQSGGDIGSYTKELTDLTSNTIYYYKAYATNSAGTAYGEVRSFRTLGSFIDSRDGTTYTYVRIGDQTWMAENLRYKGNTTQTSSYYSSTEKYRYCPGGSDENVATYGYLYNWPAAMNGASSSSSNPSNRQGICPDGWHLPSNSEWTQLTDYLSSRSEYQCDETSTNIAKSLASTTGWHYYFDNTCAIGDTISDNNSSGFGALPAGYYYHVNQASYNPFRDFELSACFWSATQSSDYIAYNRYLGYSRSSVNHNNDIGNKDSGMSVRCVKNE